MHELQGWLARRDHRAVAKAIAMLSPAAITQCEGDAGFALFMHLTDRWVRQAAGLSVHDLADFNSRDAYESGDSPKETALAVLREAGFE